MKSGPLRLLALLLVLASVTLFALHYALFRDTRGMAYYLVYDLAFLPLNVLLVTLLLDQLLSAHERRDRQHKMNMVIGAFFSTVGRGLLGGLTELCRDRAALARSAAVAPDWSEQQVRAAIAWAGQQEFRLDVTPPHLLHVREILNEHREFMLRLLENPMLLEHETFTDLLWATFHLHEELAARQDLTVVAEPDLGHLTADAERAYGYLVTQWLAYLRHLKADYPFLFSFAARTNPLREGARAEVLA